MISPGEPIVVAVSGGPDSVCLLHVLNKIGNELGHELIVAHFNHGLRPAEDDRETGLVKELAGSLNLPFVEEKADSELSENGSSLEERAREARYKFLESVRAQRNAGRIAIGHTMNDQAETIIMRLLRGSGPSGLAGIPPVRGGTIIRPLFSVKREEVIEYLGTHHLSSCLDSSNLKPTHLRNRIRLEIMPLLTQLQPNLIEQLAVAADILRDENEYLDTLAEKWIRDYTRPGDPGTVSVPVDLFQNLHPALKNNVLRSLIKRVRNNLLRIEYDHILAVSNLVNSGKPQGRLDLPNGLVAVKAYDRLDIGTNQRKTEYYEYPLEGPGRYYIKEIDRTLTLTIIQKGVLVKDNPKETAAYLDADTVNFPMVIRSFRPGDRFIPLGMRGHKKIKDFFIDLKVPHKERASTPILICDHTPVWVCGYRINDRFKVTSSTKRILMAVIDLI
jgi:tRNA(Ile)-lysidine synthase